MIQYDLGTEVLAFTAGRGCHGCEPGVDAREVGLSEDHFRLLPSQLMIPRQTHSANVAWVSAPGEVPDTDAVITDVPGLCVAVKTADCIPVLLYDARQRLVAAVHAGWRGTVARIVQKAVTQMNSRGQDLRAVIGPGISLEAFEVGDEVYTAFADAGFPMEQIAVRRAKWHLNLWEANAWLLRQMGVTDIHVAGICTYRHLDKFYSARQETIRTGRNINGIMIRP